MQQQAHAHGREGETRGGSAAVPTSPGTALTDPDLALKRGNGATESKGHVWHNTKAMWHTQHTYQKSNAHSSRSGDTALRGRMLSCPHTTTCQKVLQVAQKLAILAAAEQLHPATHLGKIMTDRAAQHATSKVQF